MARIQTRPRFYACPCYCKFDDDPIKLNWLSCPQHFLHYKFRHSRACDSKANSPIWREMELAQDFMPVLVICKFEEIRPNLKALKCPHHSFQRSGAGNSKVNRRMCPELEHFLDPIAVLVICKFINDPIKNKGTIVSTVNGKHFRRSRACNSKVNSLIPPEIGCI